MYENFEKGNHSGAPWPGLTNKIGCVNRPAAPSYDSSILVLILSISFY